MKFATVGRNGQSIVGFVTVEGGRVHPVNDMLARRGASRTCST